MCVIRCVNSKLIFPNTKQRRTLQTPFFRVRHRSDRSRAYVNAIGVEFARRVKRAANPYNALQPFTTKALRDAEL